MYMYMLDTSRYELGIYDFKLASKIRLKVMYTVPTVWIYVALVRYTQAYYYI